MLIGNSGDNVLDGGSGVDTMVGGLGNDTYVVDNVGDVITENAGEGIDTVQSSITYTLGANLENLKLTGVINGTGNALDNVLTGSQYSNVLDGGLGADTMIGGQGDDTYIVDNAGDIVIENAGEGTDTVQSSITYTLSDNVENLTLTGSGNINGTGNTMNNTLTGNSGDNVLDGGAGNDTMAGGLGNDTYIVDSTSDVVTESSGGGTDTVLASASYTLSSYVENLTLTGTVNINGTGNSSNNILIGNSGDNVLNGGSGNDTMIGGLGNDTYIVDSTGDVITENADEGIDTVQASVTYTLSANVENLILTGVINGTGNALDNVLTGSQYNNTLDGGLGADTMIGGLGNDTYVVDNAGDVVVENAGEGTDTVQSSITYTLGANLENLTLTGTAAIDGTGNELNNTINGNSGDNVLDGGAGNDTMVGGLGNDTYIVDSTSDVVTESASAGTDTVLASVNYTLGLNVENLTLTGTANINGTGNTLNNILIGNSGDNVLDGGSGNDTLYGGAGNDILRGGLGDDIYLYGVGSGNDTINSYEGTSGNGNDSLQFQNLVMAAVEFTANGSDLVCTITSTGETVRLTNWTLGSNYQVDQLQFSDGTLTATEVSQRIA
jgi:Ca2+-binding RTX toxin-like protein